MRITAAGFYGLEALLLTRTASTKQGLTNHSINTIKHKSKLSCSSINKMMAILQYPTKNMLAIGNSHLSDGHQRCTRRGHSSTIHQLHSSLLTQHSIQTIDAMLVTVQQNAHSAISVTMAYQRSRHRKLLTSLKCDTSFAVYLFPGAKSILFVILFVQK